MFASLARCLNSKSRTFKNNSNIAIVHKDIMRVIEFYGCVNTKAALEVADDIANQLYKRNSVVTIRYSKLNAAYFEPSNVAYSHAMELEEEKSRLFVAMFDIINFHKARESGVTTYDMYGEKGCRQHVHDQCSKVTLVSWEYASSHATFEDSAGHRFNAPWYDHLCRCRVLPPSTAKGYERIYLEYDFD